jgi:hypothetical protein
MTTTDTLTVRRATSADAHALAALARLDSARPLHGEVLVAESAGRPVAAVALADQRAVADPFQRTAEAVDVLRVRAAQMHAARPARRAALRRLRTHTASG